MFEIVSVHTDRRDAGEEEQLGTKLKFWFYDEQNRLMLFKAVERNTTAGHKAAEECKDGEDWAEKIACELCKELALPHVHYELATWKDKPGVVCETCVKPPMSLVLGNQLLFDINPQYVRDSKKNKGHEHTVEAVTKVLNDRLLPPPEPWAANLPSGIKTALDVFIGYIMLDAWIANQDRHHENWGILFNVQTKERYLAPTFDHGACLARNISDDERKDRLDPQDQRRRISVYVQRAKSEFYTSDNPRRPLKTFEAWRVFSLQSRTASIIWQERLRAVEDAKVEQLLAEVPVERLSTVGREFTRQLLAENRRRLLEEK
ncbi:MAG: hypothetical protein FWD53_10145 [Phycisphaerales bacterium]|nr:hypothetical protein [Phycisphaerales bacterium]